MKDGGYDYYPKSRLLNGRRSTNFDGDLYLRVPKAGISNHKLPDEEFRLQCSSIVSKQERSTYDNKTKRNARIQRSDWTRSKRDSLQRCIV
ncbi:hypothetical protein CFP56_043108 [Quercus suber]|uniref:Uncharacterized protein n=1 Tax=Quercus suber TaxID=58331 RepID=A0AAW0LKT5_QUESU